MALSKEQEQYISQKKIYLDLLGRWGYGEEVKILMKDLDNAWHKLSPEEQQELRGHFAEALSPKSTQKRSRRTSSLSSE